VAAFGQLPRFHHRLPLQRSRVRRLRVHGTIARAEHREPPLVFELVMKLARELPALVHRAALGMMLVGAPLSAAGLVEEGAPSLDSSRPSWDGEYRVVQAVVVAAPRDSKSHSYSIGVAITSATNLSFESSAGRKSSFDVPVQLSDKYRKRRGIYSDAEGGIEWSPGIANWSYHEARLFGLDLKHLNGERGVPLTVFGQQIVLSAFTLGRNRFKLRFSTAF
jgi:hypothetical protein